MPSEFLRNQINRKANRSPARNPAPFIKVYMGVGASHRAFLASDNLLASFASRTSSLNPPVRAYESGSGHYGTSFEATRKQPQSSNRRQRRPPDFVVPGIVHPVRNGAVQHETLLDG